MERLIWLFHFLFFFFHNHFACSTPFSSSPLSNHLCHPDERSSLQQFKQMFTIDSYATYECDEFGGSPSYPKTLSWNETMDTDCCSWDGVSCDVSTGHVTGLDLSCSYLYGTIHPNTTLFQLSHLQKLNLAFNNFNSSTFPPSFSRFTSLTHLNLSLSNLFGAIPSKISHLSKLISLDLSFQEGPRLEPHNFKMVLKNLTQLQDLVLKDVNISSNLPDSLLNLSFLVTLDLSWTGLLGDSPYEIFQLPKLEQLYLGDNNFAGNLSEVKWSNNSSLKKLDLSYNKFSGPLPESLGNLARITQLHLEGNGFNGQVPSTLSNLKELTDLSIGYNNLNGEIPDSFVKLVNLEYLDLSGNNFTNPIPRWVTNLTQLVGLHINDIVRTGPIPSYIAAEFRNLQVLSLSNNSHNGSLPSWLFTIPSLKRLVLSYNQLTGQIHEFQRDSPLEFIDLSYNKLHGPIPQSILGLVNLSSLSLESNNLNGGVEFQKFSSLRYLDLSKNNISVSIGSNANASWPNLQQLNLSSCNITKFPNFLQNSAENLIVLDLSNNKIRGEIPSSICNLSFLEAFVLSHNNLIGVIPQCLGNFENLIFLDLSNNQIRGEIPKWVKGASSLQYLDLSHNYLQGPLLVPSSNTQFFLISHNTLTGEIPSSICDSSSLEILVLSHNNLTGVIPQCLGNVSNDLSVLDLRMNRFHGAIPTRFAINLRSLNLNGNHLQGLVPQSLANCKTMEVLDLGNNNLNGAFPHWLESIPELQVLILKSNRFHGSIGTSGTEIPFPKLRIFDLSHNNFSGLLPQRYFLNFKAMMNMDNTVPDKQYMSSWRGYYNDSVIVTMKGLEIELVRILTIFTVIDFSSNNFGGGISNVIGKLNSLVVLNFSHNRLAGHIPESLGGLTSLESLDISSNHLTGRIPSQLTSLTFLEVLNLSWNHLNGPLPNGPQFNTFENSSYAGNSELCGLPLSKKCEDNLTEVQPPVLQQEEDDPYFDGFFWKIVAIGYGCGIIVGLFVGSLMFLIGGPKFFVRLAEREVPKKVIRLRRLPLVTNTVGRRK